MADPQELVEQMIRLLREKGGRLTSQRVAMLRILAKSEGHPSAEQIYKQLKTDYPTTSLATVYKTLSLLKSMGEVLELTIPNVGSHYDGNKPCSYPHVICTKCSRIIDAEFGSLAGISQAIAWQTGYKITHQQLNFLGLCPKCQQEEQLSGESF